MQAVRWRNWKAVMKGRDGQLVLFDLTTDPGELNDNCPRHLEIVNIIETYFKTARIKSDY